MPDFTVAPTAGLSVGTWADADAPARDNPATGHAARRLLGTGAAPSTLEFTCSIGGVTAPLDTDAVLGGVTFSWWWVEWPGDPDPGPYISPVFGQSSVAHASVSTPGHYCLGVRREVGASSGPAWLVHFDYHP